MQEGREGEPAIDQKKERHEKMREKRVTGGGWEEKENSITETVRERGQDAEKDKKERKVAKKSKEESERKSARTETE